MLPTTRHILSERVRKVVPQGGVQVLLIQHLLADTAEFVKLLDAVGLRPTAFLPIPYSIHDRLLPEVEVHCECVARHELEQLPAAAMEHLLRWADSGRPILVHEVGGYLAEPLREAPHIAERILPVIEETKQGLWRYERAWRNGSRTRVLQFADSRLKTLEAEFVGRAVARAVEEDLLATGRYMDAALIGVVGVGDIGHGVATSLRRRGATVLCFDTSKTRVMEAAARGFRCVDLSTLLSSCDVIVGATGVRSLKMEDIERAKDGVLLCSASSRRIEFPVEELAAESQVQPLSGFVDRHVLLSGRSVHLSSKGHPVNFRNISLPAAFSDLMFAQVADSIARVLLGEAITGVQNLSAEDEERIAEEWWRYHGPPAMSDGSWLHRI